MNPFEIAPSPLQPTWWTREEIEHARDNPAIPSGDIEAAVQRGMKGKIAELDAGVDAGFDVRHREIDAEQRKITGDGTSRRWLAFKPTGADTWRAMLGSVVDGRTLVRPALVDIDTRQAWQMMANMRGECLRTFEVPPEFYPPGDAPPDIVAAFVPHPEH